MNHARLHMPTLNFAGFLLFVLAIGSCSASDQESLSDICRRHDVTSSESCDLLTPILKTKEQEARLTPIEVNATCKKDIRRPLEFQDTNNFVFRINEGVRFTHSRYHPVEGRRTNAEADKRTSDSKESTEKTACWIADWSYLCPHTTAKYGESVKQEISTSRIDYINSINGGVPIEDEYGGQFSTAADLIEEECGRFINGWRGTSTHASVVQVDKDGISAFQSGVITISIERIENGGIEITWDANGTTEGFCHYDMHGESATFEWRVNNDETKVQEWIIQDYWTAPFLEDGYQKCHVLVPRQYVGDFLNAIEQEGRLYVNTLVFNINGYDQFVAPVVNGVVQE